MTQTRPARRRVGRPAGSPPNRKAILAAARQQFLQRGYSAATIRSIAEAAGIDPALVHHYFGSKDQLLLVTLQEMAQVEEALPALLAGDTATLGERVLRATLEAYQTTYRPLWGVLLEIVRLAAANEAAACLLREAFGGGGLLRLIEALGRPQPQLRAVLLGSTLFGLAHARFVIRLEPIASADVESIVAWYAPTIQRYLTGALPGDERRSSRARAAPLSLRVCEPVSGRLRASQGERRCNDG